MTFLLGLALGAFRMGIPVTLRVGKASAVVAKSDSLMHFEESFH
jgi:hypothetical protein